MLKLLKIILGLDQNKTLNLSPTKNGTDIDFFEDICEVKNEISDDL